MSNAATLRLYYLAVFAALGVYVPLFPAWLEGRGLRGLSMSAVAALLPAMGILGPPAFGLFADAFALRGRLLVVACAGSFGAFALLAAAGLADVPLGFAVIFGLLLVFALFRSPTTMLADVAALEASVEYGRLRLFGSLGFLLAALAASSFVDPRRPAAVPLAIAALLGLALLVAWRLPARAALPARLPLGAARALIASRDFRLFLITITLWQASHACYDLCISLHLRDLGASGSFVGEAWAIATAAEVLLMAASGTLLERVPPRRLLALALSVTTARWLVLGAVSSRALLLALQPLHAVSFGATWIAALGWLKRRVPDGARGTAQGAFATAAALGGAGGMLAWGPVYARWGGGVTFTAASGVAAIAVLVAAAFGAAREGRRDPLHGAAAS